MQMRRLALLLFCMLPIAALLYGCGSSNKEGAGTPSTVAAVGDTACVQCHSATKDSLTGETIVAQYNKSAHYLAGQGCESCHGGGAQHNGVGPIPYPAPDAARCAACHTNTNSTVFQAALLLEGSDKNPANPSNHANGGYEGIATGERCYRCHTGEGAVLSNVAGYTGDANIINNNAYKLTQDRDFTKFKGIQCSTCHEHGGALRKVNTRDAAGNVVVWDPNGNRKVDQFDLCTSCHTYQNPDGTLVASGTAASGTKPATAPYYHSTAWYRIIATTHWDNPATTGPGGTNTPIEGYVIRMGGANPCFDCHGHEAKTNTRPNTTPARPATIHTDWANSAHGGKLLANKIAASKNPDGTWKSSSTATVDAVMNAYTDDASSTWSHYDWDNTATRATCQRCHTATGAENYMMNPPKYNADGTVASGYNPVTPTNTFTHLSGWTTTTKTSPQNEVLYCWGCHSNAGKGTLHNPGAFSFWYGNNKTNANPNGLLVTFPDAKNSNVCMTCHSGRTEVAQVIKNDTRDGSNASIMYPHYMASSLIVFGNGGYEYAGRSYAAPSYYAHDKIGISAPNTGTTSGPCAGCHMSSGNKHMFTNLAKDSTGKITAITSTSCVTCHSGNYALTAAKLEEEKEEYEASINVIAAAFVPKGVYYDSHTNNYFFNAPVGRATANRITNWKAIADSYGTSASWKDVMGVAYNLYTLGHDAGWVHNRIYSKRLIWDSIDFIFNGKLDNDVVAAIDAQAASGRITAAQAAAAKTYLGASRP